MKKMHCRLDGGPGRVVEDADDLLNLEHQFSQRLEFWFPVEAKQPIAFDNRAWRQLVLSSNRFTIHNALLSRDPDAELRGLLDEYENTYSHCGTSWTDVWSCGCDDECPECGADVEVSSSRFIQGLQETSSGALTFLTADDEEAIEHSLFGRWLIEGTLDGSPVYWSDQHGWTAMPAADRYPRHDAMQRAMPAPAIEHMRWVPAAWAYTRGAFDAETYAEIERNPDWTQVKDLVLDGVLSVHGEGMEPTWKQHQKKPDAFGIIVGRGEGRKVIAIFGDYRVAEAFALARSQQHNVSLTNLVPIAMRDW